MNISNFCCEKMVKWHFQALWNVKQFLNLSGSIQPTTSPCPLLFFAFCFPVFFFLFFFWDVLSNHLLPLRFGAMAIIKGMKGGPKGSTTKQSEAAEINGKQKPNTVALCWLQPENVPFPFSFPFEQTAHHPPVPPTHFSAPLRGAFSPVAAADSFLLPWRSGNFSSFCLFLGRVRAKIRKILFCLLCTDFILFFPPFYYLFRIFFLIQHQISGFQFQCRIKVAACYSVGWRGGVAADVGGVSRREQRANCNVASLAKRKNLWLLQIRNSRDLRIQNQNDLWQQS